MLLQTEPPKLLRIFAEAQEHDSDILVRSFHPQALRLLLAVNDLNLHRPAFVRTLWANEIFIRVMTSRKEPEKALRRLNEAGVFGKFVLLDFGRVVAQMHFDMYHTHTVDEPYTIRARSVYRPARSGRARPRHAKCNPGHERGAISRRALYVAVFLHDIAKAGAGAIIRNLRWNSRLKFVPGFGLTGEETETVSWLVREHLTMSDTAFKRDVDDPQTIMGS